MYLKNEWQVAAFSKEVSLGAPFARVICDEPIAFFRTASGRLAAVEDRCAHRGTPLSLGRVVGETLQCGYHGACFDTHGKCVSVPGQKVISFHARVRAYPVAERFGCIWIWIGDEALADAAKIPDVHWMNDPLWVASTGYHHIRANYQLLTDNLLDLSHETYVHGKTIGHEAVAESAETVSTDSESVTVAKEMPNCTAPPFYQHAARVSATDRVNRWQRTRFLPPAYTVIDVGVDPINAAAPAIQFNGRVINLITPETGTTSHYFWAFARSERLDEPALTEYLRAAVDATFEEDKVMLEGQQTRMNHPTHPTFGAAFRTDVAPMQARKLLARLIAAQQVTHTPVDSFKKGTATAEDVISS